MITVISILLNIVLFGILVTRGRNGQESGAQPKHTQTLTKEYKWKLDSPRGVKLQGQLSLELDPQSIMEQRRNNPFASPSTAFRNEERLYDMYYYMLMHPEMLVNSSKIIQYINRLCSQQNISELDKLQFVLDFVQEPNIRYILDSDGPELAGAVQYVRFPDETLLDGHGDCDCKSFLAITLYHLMGYSVLYLLSQKLHHAAICIEYDRRWKTSMRQPSDLSDVTVEINGQQYIFCETTSDGFRIGGIGAHQSINDFETKLEFRA